MHLAIRLLWITFLSVFFALGTGMLVLALAHMLFPQMDASATKKLGDSIGLPVFAVSIMAAVWLANNGKLPGTKEK